MGNARFIGTYYRSLDAKGRLLLPPAFLAAIESSCSQSEAGPRFWLTSLYGRITGYFPEDWEQIAEQLCKIQIPSLKLSNFKTKLLGMAHELEPDNQGRVRIPQPLMREGHLIKDIVLVGVFDKFEIWDQASFEAVPNEDVSEELASCGIQIKL